jgi:ribosomal protein S12 methylthiotransferase
MKKMHSKSESIRHGVGILSLGCPRNLVDSENILGRLRNKGYAIVDMEEAEIGIVNTCAFIEDAKKESIDAILDLIELKKTGRLKKILVYGCLVQRYKDKLTKLLPEIDAFVGCVSLNHSNHSFSLTPSHYAYLKICEGCLNNCSYCTIPKIKKGFSSLGEDSVLDKVRVYEKHKLSELNIIGQDTSGYGMDLSGRCELATLLKKIVAQAKDIGWIRLLYLYPDIHRISDELLDLIADEPKICKYIDLPIQHINERILKLMRRNTKKKDILQLIDKIRNKIPEVGLRTSLIVGFPQETEAQFRELVRFIEEVKFERLGVFMYSREEDTPAFNLSGQVEKKVKEERFNTIMLKQQEVSRSVNQRFLGRVIDVLIDESKKDHYLGRTQWDAPEADGLVYVKSKQKLSEGDFVRAKITDTLEYDLVGEVMV